MEKMHDLKDLLKHEVLDLVSAEEQIIAALPKMIEKAGNASLKEALTRHLQITEQQRARLDQVQGLLSDGEEQTTVNESGEGEKKRGFIAGLFQRNKNGKQECLGTKGLIEEGEKMMGENMEPEVMDAAIIGCAQKIEHYEICGYGTAKAYARELNLPEVERLLEQTLNEEYEADDQLTTLAVGRLNKKAEEAAPGNNPSSSKERKGGGESRVNGITSKQSLAKKGGNGTANNTKGAPAKTAFKVAGGNGRKSANAKSNTTIASQSKVTAAPKKGSATAAKNNGSPKTASKKSSSKAASKKQGTAVKRK